MIDFLIHNGVYIMLVIIAIWATSVVTKSYRLGSAYAKAYQNEMDLMNQNKCEDNEHDWIYMELKGERGRVCKTCCWSQSHETFVKKFFVEAELSQIRFNEGFDKYKAKRLSEISEEFNVSMTDIIAISEKVITIKKNYTVAFIGNEVARHKKGQKDNEGIDNGK